MRFSSHQTVFALRSLGLALVLVGSLEWPVAACAEGERWPLDAPADTLVAFGATYTGADGQPATHRGVDLAAEPGDRVVSPCAGVVRFVGRVPALGSSGTQLALTIERGDGLRFTLMPLGSECVATGARVDVGTAIGDVAGQGDASSACPHLHVGARRGELYVDPLEFLDATESAAEAEPEVSGTSGGSTTSAQPATAVTARATSPARSTPRSTSTAEGASAARAKVPKGSTASRVTGERTTTAQTNVKIPNTAFEGATRATSYGSGQTAAGHDHAAVVDEAMAPAGSPRSSLWGLVSAAANRSVPAAGRSLSRLVRAWFVAAIALLAAAGALWPLWRRAQSVEEPGPCVAPVGGEIAAAAGR